VYGDGVSKPNSKTARQDLLEVLPFLLEHHPEQAVQTLEWTVQKAKSKHDFALLLDEVLLKLAPQPFLNHLGLARVYALVCCRARDSAALEPLLTHWEGLGSRHLGVFRAWIFIFRGQHPAALHALEGVEQPLPRWEQGFFLRLQGECAARLGQPIATWQPYFVAARDHLDGPNDQVSLGLCMMFEANLLYEAQECSQARTLWAKALPLLRNDVFYSAWWRYNLGLTYLREQDFIKAERHFMALEQLIPRADAAQFRACAYSGFGAVRRALGEWDRALSCYQHALKYAKQNPTDTEDLETAFWGMGLVLRVQGKADEALGRFQEAYQVRQQAWLWIEQAACCLQMGDFVAATHLLERASYTETRHQNLFFLVRGEIARVQHNPPALLQALEGIDFAHPSLKQEVQGFHQLFKVALELGFSGVLEGNQKITTPQNTVRVKAEGTFQVWVNNRAISLKATGYPAQVLVYLLEQGGRAHLGNLTTALFEERATEHQQARKALHPHIVKLRKALGWENSVLAASGSYQLDPAAVWDYDIATMRKQKQRPRAFMEGVGKEWVLDTLRELENV
jgi:tetratricopeptide (TPR) repeat protein